LSASTASAVPIWKTTLPASSGHVRNTTESPLRLTKSNELITSAQTEQNRTKSLLDVSENPRHESPELPWPVAFGSRGRCVLPIEPACDPTVGHAHSGDDALVDDFLAVHEVGAVPQRQQPQRQSALCRVQVTSRLERVGGRDKVRRHCKTPRNMVHWAGGTYGADHGREAHFVLVELRHGNEGILSSSDGLSLCVCFEDGYTKNWKCSHLYF
jgi:hypothetical protein